MNGDNMKNDTVIQLSKKPLWKRNIAIHEAGHALAAWLSGSRQIQIALADEFRIARLSHGQEVEDCEAVCNYTRGTSAVIPRLVICFSGVMAEHVYSGDDPEELLKKGGRGDASDISEILKECRARGSTQDECDSLYNRAYDISLKMVKRYWWEIIALAKMTEHVSHVPNNKIGMLLNLFYSTSGRNFSFDEKEFTGD